MYTKLYKWLNNIQFSCIPSLCVLCGDQGGDGLDLCAACRESLPLSGPACIRCGQGLQGTVSATLCGSCQLNPPAFAQTLAPYRYQVPLDDMLQRLKFNGRLEIARILGRLMGDWLEPRVSDWPGKLIPVPLHAGRLRERGFNQSLELARLLARRFQIPLAAQCCERRRVTSPQSGLSRKARRKNVQGVFAVPGRVSGHVAIVDDVMTTGSTVHELARVLLKAGADRVDVWVCARA